jgi:hypothetical protein
VELRAKQKDYLSRFNRKAQKAYSPILRMAIINVITGRGKTITDITRLTGIREETVRSIITSLTDSGYAIEQSGNFVQLRGGIPEHKPLRIDSKALRGKIYEFGVVSDCHLGSYNERVDVLNSAYDDFKRRGIKTVYLPGNIVEGEAKINKYDIRVHGITDQTLYVIDHFPQKDGITTYFITADDHEGWWFQREGIDFGRYLMLEAENRGRKDLVHIGYQEVDVELPAKRGKSIMRLLHPGGGGSYAISYALQKITESYQGGEKPHIILCGHYHKAGYFYPREVHSVLCGTTCDQSRFMRKLKLQAHVGYWIVKLKQADNGTITEFNATFKPFYDRKFYVAQRIK